MQLMKSPILATLFAMLLLSGLFVVVAMIKRNNSTAEEKRSHSQFDKFYLLLASTLISLLVFQALEIFIPKGGMLRSIVIGDGGGYAWPYTIQAVMWFLFVLFFSLFIYRVWLDETVSTPPSTYELKRSFYDSKLETLNYISWSIPTFGFIGTVIGLMESLGVISSSKDIISDMQNGLMTDVLQGLTVAFSTTILGLMLSVLCMGSFSWLAKVYYKKCSVDGSV